MTTSGTTSENEWQVVTTSGTTNGNAWQWATAKENEWQWVAISAKFSFFSSVLNSFPIFTGKHLCWSLFLKNLHVLKPASLLMGDPNTGVFLLLLQNF